MFLLGGVCRRACRKLFDSRASKLALPSDAKQGDSKVVRKWYFHQMEKDALPPENECTTDSKPQAGDTRKINLSQMIGSFYILMFGLFGALGALLIEYVYLTTKNKGHIPQIRGIQCKLMSYACPSMFSAATTDPKKKFMHSRMYPGTKEQQRSTRKRKDKKSKTKNSYPRGYYSEDWKNRSLMGEHYVGFDEHGRRDIYTNYKDSSRTVFGATCDQPKSYAIKRNYDNPNLGRQMMEEMNRSAHSEDSGDSSEERQPRRNKSYFTYGEGDYRRY